MSIKVSTFANIITQPLNVHNFLVEIPDVSLAVVVSGAAFPAEKLREVKLYYQGEEIRYPTIPSNDGSWKVKIPESDSGAIRKQFDALKQSMYKQKTGIFIPSLWKTISVTARDLQNNPVFSVLLHGAWLVGRESVDLQNNDPTKSWEWDYEFRYQWLEDVDLKNKGSQAPI